MTQDRDPAMPRYFAIQAARLAGAVLTALGLLIVGGKIALPPVVGVGIAIVGLAVFAVIPLRLARRWRSPRE